MQNKKLIRFVESFVIMPVLTIPMSLGAIPKPNIDIPQVPQIVFTQKQNTVANGLLAINQEVDQKAKILKIKADAIDAYFKSKNMPLEGKGMKFAQVAEENDLDYRLLVGISAIETTGGKAMCKNPKAQNNPFGWGSCKIGFDSIDEAIEKVGKHLGGNVESTAKHYANKDTLQILNKYNPPYIVHDYAKRVMNQMKEVGDEIITLPTDA